ncbi:hypothetical protein ACOMHN_058938 [Nucella lapillus]
MMAAVCGINLWTSLSLFSVLVVANRVDNGQRREYACEVSAMKSLKGTINSVWTIVVMGDDDKSVLVLLNVLKNNCLTHGDYSSCVVDSADPRGSRVRVLVADLREGEHRKYGCDVKAFTARGQTSEFSRFIVVSRPRLEVHQFRGFPSLQEVECSGRELGAEVDLLSLSIYRVGEQGSLGTLHVIKNSCFTQSQYASCSLSPEDSRQSSVRVLVADLKDGESRQYGCEAVVINAKGKTNASVWIAAVRRRLSARHFKGLPEIQEVECRPENLQAGMKLLSLTLYRADDKSVLVLLNVLNDNCLTHGDYSSCVVDSVDPRGSRVRVLVADLPEGENRKYGCDVKAFTARGQTSEFSRFIVVSRPSELFLW